MTRPERGVTPLGSSEGGTVECVALPPAEEIRRAGLAATLRDATTALHRQAERSGVVSDILHGHATRDAYALLLRNLLPVYAALEDGLERHRASPAVSRVVRPDVYRAGAIRHDLVALQGPNFATELPLLAAGEDYVRAVEDAAAGDGVRLIAHAYTRYLGDLSGGQVMSKLIGKTLGLHVGARTLYRFSEIADLDLYKVEYRAAIDRAAFETERPDTIVAEAMQAFRHNIALFWAVQEAAEAMPGAGRRPVG